MSEVKFAALDAADASLDRLEFWGNDNPKCPHCGQTFDICRHEWHHLYEEGEHELTCPDCDWEFMVNTNVKYTFSTDEQEREDEDAALSQPATQQGESK